MNGTIAVQTDGLSGYGRWFKIPKWKQLRVKRIYVNNLRKHGFHTYRGTRWITREYIIPRLRLLIGNLEHQVLTFMAIPPHHKKRIVEQIRRIGHLAEEVANKILHTGSVYKRRMMVIHLLHLLRSLPGIVEHILREMAEIKRKEMQVIRFADKHFRYKEHRLYYFAHKY